MEAIQENLEMHLSHAGHKMISLFITIPKGLVVLWKRSDITYICVCMRARVCRANLPLDLSILKIKTYCYYH